MEKSTLPTRYLTSDGSKIVAAPYFLYEVTTYKLYKKRVECCSSNFFKSSKPIQIKKKIINKKDYILEQSILWIAAPIDYIRDYHLQVYDPMWSKKSKKK